MSAHVSSVHNRTRSLSAELGRLEKTISRVPGCRGCGTALPMLGKGKRVPTGDQYASCRARNRPGLLRDDGSGGWMGRIVRTLVKYPDPTTIGQGDEADATQGTRRRRSMPHPTRMGWTLILLLTWLLTETLLW